MNGSIINLMEGSRRRRREEREKRGRERERQTESRGKAVRKTNCGFDCLFDEKGNLICFL